MLNHDVMAEGTHFRPDANMADVAWKLVASNLSDLAAKGAEPIGVLLGHCLGTDNAGFVRGLSEALEAFGVTLLGGDTVKVQGSRVLGLTAIGRATHTPVPSRSGAQAGDGVFVTGTLGLAMRGFEGDPDHIEAFNRPTPRLAEGYLLAPIVSAMMDVSDGLLLDGFRMAKTSNVTFELEERLVPIADPSRSDEGVRWGDDYELLFTMPEDIRLPVPATKIGKVLESRGFPLIWNGDAISTAVDLGYQHG